MADKNSSVELSGPDTNGIFVLKMKAGENRFNPTFMKQFGDSLDVVEKSEGACALITVGEGKFYSNGLDLNWMTENGEQGVSTNLRQFMGLIGRVLVLPFPTISAINGHAFAAGWMLALAHDFRIMQEERGFICLPEVDIHLGLTPGMNALVTSKITDPNTQRDSILLGKRYTAKEAHQLKMIDFAVPGEQVLVKAKELATKVASKGEDRHTFGVLKAELYNKAHRLLTSGNLGLAIKTAKL